MELTRITLFTIASAAAATALMIVPGLALAWLLARGRFRGRLILETLVSMPLVMPPVATGLILLLLCAPRGPHRPGSASGRHRHRVHLESRRPGNGGDGPAAVCQNRARRHRAGRSTLRSRRGDSGSAAAPGVLHDHPAPGASVRSGRHDAGVRTGDRRVRGDDRDCREHSRRDANARGRDLQLHRNRPRRRGRAPDRRIGSDCVRRAVDFEPVDRAAPRQAPARDPARFHAVAGQVHPRAARASGRLHHRAVRAVRRGQDDHPRGDCRAAAADLRNDRDRRPRVVLVDPRHRRARFTSGMSATWRRMCRSFRT